MAEAYHPAVCYVHGNDKFTSALEVAVASNQTSTVQLLLDRGFELIMFEDSCVAAAIAVKKLLANGADINLGAGLHGTPFVNAIINGNEQMYQLFLDHGANTNPLELYALFETRFRLLWSTHYSMPEPTPPSKEAITARRYRLLQCLFLDLGVPVNTGVGKYGNALAVALKKHGWGADKETVKMLLAHLADVNQAGGKYGTPL
ncbi:uncharacterized protein A1O9_12553 [Exophiala aquamarina CBS 119918]|uniref:Uncharacterized protein n=1 Tax=Exophiala aquamarina CBS 119918 TaxID=1182545 RepID=A0A072NU64_9EURO|nr:uncharacterized protein A1O9_12553 [Exophiala aquamarina CBS 119918]KEF51404.1 hypothetical protein A1O9_12553 [Exophiala aquamarina CBS 119918]